MVRLFLYIRFLRNSLIFMSGTGPDAFFYVGKKGTFVHSANQKGIWIPYPIWSRSKLSAYAGKTIHLELDKDININEEIVSLGLAFKKDL